MVLEILFIVINALCSSHNCAPAPAAADLTVFPLNPTQKLIRVKSNLEIQPL